MYIESRAREDHLDWSPQIRWNYEGFGKKFDQWGHIFLNKYN